LIPVGELIEIRDKLRELATRKPVPFNTIDESDLKRIDWGMDEFVQVPQGTRYPNAKDVLAGQG
jgi:hypothetical protein